MGGGALDAVPVVDTALASLVIDVEVLEVVVEIDAPGAKVAAQKGSVGCENSGHVHMTLAEQRDCKASLPFVEMGDNSNVQ